jgi:hypothetical protein
MLPETPIVWRPGSFGSSPVRQPARLRLEHYLTGIVEAFARRKTRRFWDETRVVGFSAASVIAKPSALARQASRWTSAAPQYR